MIRSAASVAHAHVWCWSAAIGALTIAQTVTTSSDSRTPATAEGLRFTLTNGVGVPLIGFGTAGLGSRCREAVREALQAGFRHVDTAQATEWYDEAAVGRALQDVSTRIPRPQVFLTTKVHPKHFGLDQTLQSFERSLEALQVEYVDLLLLHAPTCWPGTCAEDPRRGTWVDAWRALEILYEEGKVRAVGVSNFDIRLLEELWGLAKVKPHAVQNWHDPLHQDRVVVEWCAQRDVLYTSYSTLGTQWTRHGGGGSPVLDYPVVKALAKKHDVSPVLLTLTWALQEGAAVIPRSSQTPHIQELARLHDATASLQLSDDDMQQMRAIAVHNDDANESDEL